MSVASTILREGTVVDTYENEGVVAPLSRQAATTPRPANDAEAAEAEYGIDGEVPSSDPVAEFVPWIPIVLPLLAAAMACDFYLIGWTVLVSH